ncbi:putative F-box protein [Cardamine amara subsp. amara]|uniref:F-box protein n=1 Tax=Cardamine amara subsp. amara TaxID=228776 RepID=A0ABD0Z5D5_CARAN
MEKFEALPQELQSAILSRLPLKSVGKCICASKKLASIICTKQFRDSYLLQSMTRPRMLFMVPLTLPLDSSPTEDDLLFYSVYQEEKPLLSSGQQESYICQGPLGCMVSQPIRGLVCIRDTTKIRICNPTTKMCRTLLEMKMCEKEVIAHYFGHDEKDAFKVLCVMKMKSVGQSQGAKEYHVLTVGSTEEPWRKITCEHDHTAVTQGLCKGGVLYYVAWSNSEKSLVMMCFNVSSEEFTVTELPEEVNNDRCWTLVNYKGEIALVDDYDSDLHTNGVLQIWVRKQIDQRKWEWKKTRIVIPRDRWEEIDVDERKMIRFKGTIGTGEHVFAREFLGNRNEGPVVVLCYDNVTEELRRFKTEKEFEGFYVQTFLDHVDSFGLCED